MSHIEPSWAFGDSPDSPTAEGNPLPVELTLPVAMGSRLRKKWGEVRARSFENRGTVHVDDLAVTVQTSVTRLFRSALRRELVLRREDIYNARLEGRILQFDLSNGPGELETIVLRAANREDAKHLLDALPVQMTRTYATENRERLQFLERINARTPHVWGTWAIVALATLVYLVMAVHGKGRITATAEIAAGSNFGPDTQNGQWWRLLTAMFIHAGFLHLFVNMLVLVRAGRVAEQLFGTTRYVALYVFAGLTGSLVSLLWHPGINSVGASGAVLGVLGGIVAYLVRHGRFVPRALYLRHLQLAIVFIIYALLNGLRHKGIDNGAHLGGVIGGFLIGLVLAPPPEESRETRDERLMALGMSVALAFGLTGGMIWALGDLAVRPDRQEAMQFSTFLQQTSALETHAFVDVNALRRLPATAEGRMAAADRIRGTLMPEWQRLYDTTVASNVPPNSAEWQMRSGLLKYYGDTLNLLRSTASLIESNEADDNASKTLVLTLVVKVARERAEMIRHGKMY